MRLWSGTGEELGVVVGIEPGRDGSPKHLRFVEPGGGPERRAPLRVVRRVDGEGVHLAGPREGYHITRLGEALPDVAPPRLPGPAAPAWTPLRRSDGGEISHPAHPRTSDRVKGGSMLSRDG